MRNLGLTTLKIVFDQPMLKWVNGWLSWWHFGIKKTFYPEMTSYTWNSENELTIGIKLEPNKKYLMYFADNQMISKTGLRFKDKYILKFKTKKD